MPSGVRRLPAGALEGCRESSREVRLFFARKQGVFQPNLSSLARQVAGASSGKRTRMSALQRMAARAMERGHSCPPSVVWRPQVAKRASGHRDGTCAVFGACGGKRTRMSALRRLAARAMERGHSCPPNVAWCPQVAKRTSGHRDGTCAVFGACGGKRTRMSALQRMAARAMERGHSCPPNVAWRPQMAIRASGHRAGTCAIVGASAREADKNVRAPLREMIYEPANL